MNTETRDNRDILELFQSSFSRSEDKFHTVRMNWKADNDFSLGEQWEEGVRNDRSVAGAERPIVTVNKIDPLVRRIVNEAKQEKLEAIVRAGNDTTDPDAAEILTGYLRKVQYDSNAARAYMWAYECAVRAGLGAFKVMNEFENDESFDQTIRFGRIKDPMSVSWDPDSEDPCGRDQEFCIISNGISKIAAENLCKDLNYDPKQLIGLDENIWNLGDGELLDTEMQWIERTPDELIGLVDGTILYKSQLAPEYYAALKTSPLVQQRRKVQKKQVKYAHICGGKVLETLDINSQFITIVRMVGREGYIDGKIDYRGITRNSKDSNRMYNVMSSLLVERIGLAPRAPYIGAAGQFEGYEDQWLHANKVNLPKLEYNPVTLNGALVPPPMRNDASSGDPTIQLYLSLADTDIKDTSALSDAFMGTRSNETSGAAITARAGQSNLATYDLLDNCHAAIEFGAQIALDMAPKIISSRRVIQILGEDMKERVINLDLFQDKQGKVKSIDLGKGRFNLEVSVSSGDKTRREKAIEQLTFVMQTNPEASNLVMDVLVSNLDIKDANKIANRFKSLLPPKLLAAENDEEKDNPELAAFEEHATQLMEQMRGELDACQAELQKVNQELANKQGDLDIKQQEVNIKEREAAVKEYIALHPPVKEEKSEKGEKKSEGPKKEDSSADDEAAIMFLIQQQQEMQEEVDSIHAQLNAITQLLSQDTAPEGPTPPQEAPAMGNGLPPAEAENNVGVPNE